VIGRSRPCSPPKPNIAAFHDDNGQDLLLAGDVDLVIEYNGDIAQVMRDDPDLDFVIPREGGILASDGLCIPRGPNPDLAHAFIDFVLGARRARHRPHDPLSHPQRGRSLMPDSYRKSPVIFPRRRALNLRIFTLSRAGDEQPLRSRNDPGPRGLGGTRHSEDLEAAPSRAQLVEGLRLELVDAGDRDFEDLRDFGKVQFSTK
jgi:hypothetical protein